MAKLNYLEGKVVSVFTGPINRDLKDEAIASGKASLYPQNLLDYFVGVCESIDSNWIVLTHPIIGTKAFFNMRQVVGVVEEQYTDNPEIIEELKKRKQEEKEKNAEFMKRVSANMEGLTPCPQCGAKLKIPENVSPGTGFMCPACNHQFNLNTNNMQSMPQNDSPHVDLDSLSNMAKQAKERKK